MGSGIALFAGPMLGGIVYSLGHEIRLPHQRVIVPAFRGAHVLHKYRSTTIRAAGGSNPLTTFVADLREISRYLEENASIRKIARFAVMLNLLSAPILLVIIPYLLIVKVMGLSPPQYGLMQGFYMVGFFMGGLALSLLRIKNMKKTVVPALVIDGRRHAACSRSSACRRAGALRQHGWRSWRSC